MLGAIFFTLRGLKAKREISRFETEEPLYPTPN
jgi:hypothetical protein